MVDTTEKRTLIVFVIAIISVSIAMTIGLVLHFTIREPAPVARSAAVGNCIPQGKQDEAECSRRGCVWQTKSDGASNCTFPTRYGYVLDAATVRNDDLGITGRLKIIDSPPLYGDGLRELIVNVTYQNDQRVNIRITDAAHQRYEVPAEAVQIDNATSSTNETRLYEVTFVDQPHFGIIVKRRATGTTIFDTTTPGFVFSDQYIQLTTALPTDNVYGFGEHNHKRFRHDMNWRKWTIFTRDVAPVDEWNLYGAQTLYMNIEEDGLANGVFLLNSNAMDIVLQPNPYPAITYHIIGGILDFHIFLGPTPENVVQQYTQTVGRPLMPPYWALGFQLSRWDYHNLTHLREVVERNRAAEIPQDVQYGDIDYMESKLDFTYDKIHYQGLPEFVDDLHAHGQKYIIILDHAIGCNQTVFNESLNGVYPPYTEGLAQNIFIKDPRNKALPLVGEVWPGVSVYPDFTLGENVTDWWTRQCLNFRNSSEWNVKYDALWIDMNEPSNFVAGSTTGCNHSSFNHPPFVPNVLGAGDDGRLFDKTICMDAEQHWGLHYDVHSLYGHSMAITTYNAVREIFGSKRSLVLTRSNFAGTQKYSAHWLGDNQSQWPQMAWSIVGMLEYSLFGFSFTGADICGFWYETTEQMCQRWTQLGAFYPYSRNHNGQTFRDQDPAAFSDAMISSSRNVLNTRYKLLPFLYTLLHEAHAFGNTVARPLLHEFTKDTTALSIDRQFLWGPSLLISPVLEQDTVFVNAYFPAGRWYDYYDGSRFESTGQYRNLSTPLDRIQLHVRGGYIIPWQMPANTTQYSRLNQMGLIVALSQPSPGYSAKGNLFWDDGETFETYETGHYLNVSFEASGFGLKIQVGQNNTYAGASELIFSTVELWGLDQRITRLIVDGVSINDSNIKYDSATKNSVLSDLSLRITSNHELKWQMMP